VGTFPTSSQRRRARYWKRLPFWNISVRISAESLVCRRVSLYHVIHVDSFSHGKLSSPDEEGIILSLNRRQAHLEGQIDRWFRDENYAVCWRGKHTGLVGVPSKMYWRWCIAFLKHVVVWLYLYGIPRVRLRKCKLPPKESYYYYLPGMSVAPLDFNLTDQLRGFPGVASVDYSIVRAFYNRQRRTLRYCTTMPELSSVIAHVQFLRPFHRQSLTDPELLYCPFLVCPLSAERIVLPGMATWFSK